MSKESLTRSEVHQALCHINDNVGLSRTPLLSRFPELAGISRVDLRAEALRSELLQAIEVLRPPRRLPFGSAESRSYDVLSLRYVGSLTIDEVCEELSLSRRQVHRDLAQAEEKLTQILESRRHCAAAEGGTRAAGVDTELQHVAAEPSLVDLMVAVEESISLLQPLLRSLSAEIEFRAPARPPGPVTADAALLRQVLVQALAFAAQASADSRVRMTLWPEAEGTSVEVIFRIGPTAPAIARLEDLKSIAEAGALGCEFRLSPDGDSLIALRLHQASPASVLVVEDNAGAVELYRRYLSGPEWEVHHVSDPRRAYDVARSLRPDVIVLDVMLPKMDGWTVLGLLRKARETADIPIVICSVVNEQELGLALGAAAYLTKPVSRPRFVAALRRALVGGTSRL
ncbi:MAG: response regulator [Anaerolineae bacterium]|nr:response regulator [Anaerolineae bacterium]